MQKGYIKELKNRAWGAGISQKMRNSCTFLLIASGMLS